MGPRHHGQQCRAAWWLLCSCGILWAAWQSLLQVSLLTPDHWCREERVDSLALQLPLRPEEVRQFSIPLAPQGGFSKCKRYSDDLVAAYLQWQRDHKPTARLQEAQTIPCDQGWHYNLTMIPSTLTSQLNLVCDDRWKPAIIRTAYWLSAAGGGIVWMAIGNRYSKYISLVLSLGLSLLGSIIIMICSTYPTLLITWIAVGSCQMAFMCLPILFVKDVTSPKSDSTMHHIPTPLTVWQFSQTVSFLFFLGASQSLTSWWWLAASLPPISTICLLLSVWFTWTVCEKCGRNLHSPLRAQLEESSDDVVLYDVHFQQITLQMRDCNSEYFLDTENNWKNNIPFSLHWLLCSWCYWMLLQAYQSLGIGSDAGEPSLTLILNILLAELPSCCYPLLQLLLPSSMVICRQSLLMMSLLLAVAPIIIAVTSILNWIFYKRALNQEVIMAAVGHFGAMSILSMTRLLGISRFEQLTWSLLTWEALGASLAATMELISDQMDGKLLFLVAGIVATVTAVLGFLLPDYICSTTEIKKPPLPPLWIQRCRSYIIESAVGRAFISGKTESHSKCDSSLSYSPLQPG